VYSTTELMHAGLLDQLASGDYEVQIEHLTAKGLLDTIEAYEQELWQGDVPNRTVDRDRPGTDREESKDQPGKLQQLHLQVKANQLRLSKISTKIIMPPPVTTEAINLATDQDQDLSDFDEDQGREYSMDQLLSMA
jgi:hypothetical protein